MSRQRLGIGLLIAAVALAIAAFFTWQSASDEAERDQLAEEYRAAIDRDAAEDIEPNRAGPISLGAIGAVLFLGGIILVVVSPSSDS